MGALEPRERNLSLKSLEEFAQMIGVSAIDLLTE